MRNKIDDESFYSGVISAIAAIHAFDQPTMVEAILAAVGKQEVIEYAKKHNAIRWAGLGRYNVKTKKDDSPIASGEDRTTSGSIGQP